MEYKEYLELFEIYLSQSVYLDDSPESVIYSAMNYSLTAGGKRIRPVLMLMANSLFEVDINTCLPYALAVEMVHTYSLIHDDLPCMDNDDLRRGKKTCHKAFSEDIAVLAGDALLNCAFETMLNATENLKDIKKGVRAMHILANESGTFGMIGGQIIDMLCENQKPDEALLLRMYSKKTAALLRAPLMMGAILGNANEEQIHALSDFGENLGLAFQIQDDILDETSTCESLGKNTKSDEKNSKSTYVSLCGLDTSSQAVKTYTQKANDSLSSFGERSLPLIRLAQSLTDRKH